MALNDYRIIPNITRSLILNKQLIIYDTGNQTRTYCYVSDAICGFFKVILKDESFGVYNIGNDKGEISVIDLVKTTEEVMNVELNYKTSSYPKEYPPDEPRRRCPNINKAKNNLDFYPKISLKEGLYNHFSWAKKVFKN
jgi:UDP-glucuronate decarboxylase